jgi:hypothetical protein
MMNNRIFQSYPQADYEGTDHVNGTGLPLSMNNSVQHANLAFDDYLLIADFEIGAVRESAGWRSVEKDGLVDFSSLDSRARAAQALGLHASSRIIFQLKPHLTTKEPQ